MVQTNTNQMILHAVVQSHNNSPEVMGFLNTVNKRPNAQYQYNYLTNAQQLNEYIDRNGVSVCKCD